MATREVIAQENAPTELTGLTVGQRYSLQNIDPRSTLFVALVPSGDPPPVPGSAPAFQQGPGVLATIVQGAGETIYLWSGLGSARVVLDEAE